MHLYNPILFLSTILLDGWIYFLWFLLSLGLLGLFYTIYLQILIPYIKIKSLAVIPPPEEGSQFEVIVPDLDRFSTFTIGKYAGNLATKCNSVSENHLIFQFKRIKDTEHYDIIVKKGGHTLVKPPKMNFYSNMDSNLKLESHELISSSADFRLSDSILKERMTSYIEIHLTSQFYINSKGIEKMKFVFTLAKIHPGMSFKKDGKSYTLSKVTAKEEEEPLEVE